MLKILEKAGVNLAATSRGGNAVHNAMKNGDIATIEYLESRGLDIDTEDRVGERPIHIAIHQQFESGMDFILRRKLLVDTINQASDHCGTPLYCAAKEGNIDIAERLLCAGAMVNAVALPGNILGPALYVACAEGHAKLVRVLLSHGADTDVKTSRYGSAMEVARAFEQKEVIEVLENYGRSDVTGRITPRIPDEEEDI
ncbi:ankyrin [Cadophora sp. DSE1049]|nr:ankyrin [Cadophora sp. DSE1049]